MYKKSLLSLLCIAIIALGSGIVSAKEVNTIDTKASIEKTSVKRCPCKKIFEQTLGLSKEQVKLIDANRKEQEQTIKPINVEMRTNYKKIRDIKESNMSQDKKTAEIQKLKDKNLALKEQKSEIKIKYNSNFESYLSDEQKQTLEKMREDKKAGKHCCPCNKNRYY